MRSSQKTPYAALAVSLLSVGVLLGGCGSSSEDSAVEQAAQDAADEVLDSISDEPADEAADEAADDDSGGASGFYTCDDMVPEVVALSEDQQGEFTPAILEVYDVETTRDRQQRYVEGDLEFPAGENQVMVLRCRGNAALDNGENAPIVFELLVDKKDQLFVFYRDA